MKKWLFLTGLTIFCLSKSFSQASNKYNIEINKELWKTEPIDADEYFDNEYLNDGNLYIHLGLQDDFDIEEGQNQMADELNDIEHIDEVKNEDVLH